MSTEPSMHGLEPFRRRILIFPDLPADPHAANWAPWARAAGAISFALAVSVVYAICNAPADKLQGFLAAHDGWRGWLAPSFIAADEFVARFVAPLKGLLFAIAAAWLLVPIVRATGRARREIDRATLRRSACIALALFAFCCALCWPYHTSMWAVGNWGRNFARMSENPFAEPHNAFFRRLLKPALAHLLMFRGPLLYWIFSMACAAVLSFLIVLYLEICLLRRSPADSHFPASAAPNQTLRVLAALGVMSTNVIMLHLAAAGYVDDVAAILVMLQLVLPLTPTARLCLIALAMATHESATVFGMGPLVLVLFPSWRQRAGAWAVMGAFFPFWLASYRFDLSAAVGLHTNFGGSNTLDVFMAFPQYLGTGIFLAHKFFWAVFAVALWRLLARRQFAAAATLAACTLTALATMPIATDTSRLVALGFAGILFSIVLLLPDLRTAPGQRLFALACLLSVLIPYYPSGGHWLEIPPGGYYKAFYMYVRGWL